MPTADALLPEASMNAKRAETDGFTHVLVLVTAQRPQGGSNPWVRFLVRRAQRT